jgi:hypothetical protein
VFSDEFETKESREWKMSEIQNGGEQRSKGSLVQKKIRIKKEGRKERFHWHVKEGNQFLGRAE